MTRTACFVLAFASVACAQAMETRIHDISFFTTPIFDQPGDGLGAYDSTGATATETAWEPFSPEQIVELVKREISPDGLIDANDLVIIMEGAHCVRAPAEV